MIDQKKEKVFEQNVLILNSAGEGIYGLDYEGNTIFVNPAATRMLGYTVEELIGKPQHTLVHHSKPDGTPYPREDCHIYAAIKDGKIHRENGEVFWRKDGSSFPVEYVSTPILEDGNLTGAVVTFRDITAENREKYQNILRYELTKVLAQTHTIDKGIQSILQTLTDHPTWDMAFFWELNSISKVLSCQFGTYSKRVGPESFDIFSEQTFSHIFAKGTGLPGRVWESDKPTWIHNLIKDSNFERSTYAKKVGVYSGFGFPVFSDDNFWGVIEVFTMDRSDPDEGLTNILENMGSQIGQFMQRADNKEKLIVEKIMNEDLLSELNANVEKLKELNELKNKFLGMAAHDLRNPLVSIRGLSELLLDENNEFSIEEINELIETMHDASKHMIDLVNDLLDTSVIESGNLDLDLKFCSLVDLAQKRIQANKILAENKNMKINHTLDDIPDFNLDPNRITQVIDNLLTNAIKFSSPGTQIFVFLRNVKEGVKMSVQDQGPGLSESDQKKLFVGFQKLSARPTGGESSTGLGLAIVKKMVEAHHGTLSVESQLGVGSTFSFTLSKELK